MWDWLSDSFLCQLTGGDCFDFGADLTRLNRVSPGRVDGWLPAIILFVFLIVASSSPPFLFSPLPLFASRFCSVSGQRLIRPNPWQCLQHAKHWIGGDGAHALWWVCLCSGFRKEMGCSSRHCLSTFLLPDGAQQKECASLRSPSLYHSLSSLFPFLHLSCGSLWSMDYGFRSRTRSMSWGGRWWEPERQTGALESQVVVSECSLCVFRLKVRTYVPVIVPVRLLHFPASFLNICESK